MAISEPRPKHALNRIMPLSVLLDGIRINAVCPGIVETPILRERRAIMSASAVDVERNGSLEEPPLGRLALPEEVADICVFLSSSMSSYVHGAMVVADGGQMAAY